MSFCGTDLLGTTDEFTLANEARLKCPLSCWHRPNLQSVQTWLLLPVEHCTSVTSHLRM